MNAQLTVLQAAFRASMASVCTPVSVVTTVEAGRPHGTTVSAFTSLSMNPPMVLVSLDTGSDLLAMVQRTGTFGLNVLAASQADLAMRFAKKGPEKFRGADWIEDFGAARLGGVSSWIACRVGEIVAGGDHLIVLGEVVAAETTTAEPLTYHARTFGTHIRRSEAS